jgi:hypothetical protein
MVFLGIMVTIAGVFATAQMLRMYRLSQSLKNGNQQFLQTKNEHSSHRDI